MHGMPCKSSPLPNKTTLLWQKRRHISADQFVRDGLVTVRIHLALIAHIPRPARGAIIVTHGLFHCLESGLLGIECVSILILCITNLSGTPSSVNLKDSVVGPIDVGIYAQTKEMLMVVCVHTGVDFSAPTLQILSRVHGICVENSGQFYLKLNRSILMQNPVHAILVVGSSENMGDDKLSCASHDHAVVTEVGMLEQNAVVFFVDANGVLDGCGGSSTVDESGVEVVNRTLAVTAQTQRICHVPTPVLPQIERMLTLMWMLGVSVWYHHLSQGESPEDGSFVALVVECQVG